MTTTTERLKKLVLTAAIAGIAGTLAIPATALANGPCGQNFDGNHACGVNSPTTINGTLFADNETDFYAFPAAKNTLIRVAVTDTWPCVSSDCGAIQAELFDAQGNDVAGTNYSFPEPGIAVPAVFTHVIDKGNYFLEVTGVPAGPPLNGTGPGNLPTPYALSVTASPNVVWPAPKPYTVKRCTTKRVWRRIHHRLRKVKITTCHKVTIYP
jgi:hypothetical protein